MQALVNKIFFRKSRFFHESLNDLYDSYRFIQFFKFFFWWGVIINPLFVTRQDWTALRKRRKKTTARTCCRWYTYIYTATLVAGHYPSQLAFLSTLLSPFVSAIGALPLLSTVWLIWSEWQQYHLFACYFTSVNVSSVKYGSLLWLLAILWD